MLCCGVGTCVQRSIVVKFFRQSGDSFLRDLEIMPNDSNRDHHRQVQRVVLAIVSYRRFHSHNEIFTECIYSDDSVSTPVVFARNLQTALRLGRAVCSVDAFRFASNAHGIATYLCALPRHVNLLALRNILGSLAGGEMLVDCVSMRSRGIEHFGRRSGAVRSSRTTPSAVVVTKHRTALFVVVFVVVINITPYRRD